MREFNDFCATLTTVEAERLNKHRQLVYRLFVAGVRAGRSRAAAVARAKHGTCEAKRLFEELAKEIECE